MIADDYIFVIVAHSGTVVAMCIHILSTLLGGDRVIGIDTFPGQGKFEALDQQLSLDAQGSPRPASAPRSSKPGTPTTSASARTLRRNETVPAKPSCLPNHLLATTAHVTPKIVGEF